MRKRISSRVAVSAAVGALTAGLAAAVAAPVAQASPVAASAVRTSPWLTGGELPLASTFHWKAQPGTRYTITGEFQWLYTCGTGSPTTELHTSSVSVMQFGTAAKQVEASQVLFHFRSTAAAKAALTAVRSDYAGCAKRLDSSGMTDLDSGKPLHWTVTGTATRANGSAYRVTGRDSSGKLADASDLPSDAQELFAQYGATISMISIDGGTSKIDNATGARATLNTMSYRLTHA